MGNDVKIVRFTLERRPVVQRIGVQQVVVARQNNRRNIEPANLGQKKLQHAVGNAGVVENIADHQQHVAV